MAKPTIADVLKAVTDISNRVKQLEKLEEEPASTETKPVEPSTEEPVPTEVKPTNVLPTPSDWVEAVETILNKKFKVQVDYNSDRPSFAFSILVPREYSNASKPHWETYKEDRRTRVIENAQGVGGVKQWVERVYNNFDNETKAKITADRNLA